MSEETRVLVERCLSGDAPSLIELVRRFQHRVFGLCLRILRHHQDAEDATQETFMRFFRSLRQWKPERGGLEPWLMTIAGNRCRTELARRKRLPELRPAESLARSSDEDSRRAGLLAEELHLAMRDLRREYRHAFELFHRDELSYGEIAAEMRIPLGTVKTWVHRARRDLIARLVQRGAIYEANNHELP